MSSPYIELHARSAFSFLRGACLPEEYVALCATLGYPAMALTDVDGVYGSARFHQGAKKYGVQAHVGAEVTASDGSRYTLLVESQQGYRNLCRLITRMKLRAGTKNPKPGHEAAATPEDFAEFSEGLLCLTGGDEGPLARALRNNTGREQLEHLSAPSAPITSTSNCSATSTATEESRNQAAIEIARSMNLPLVATNGVCHASKSQREVLDVFTCLQNKTTLAEAGRLLSRNAESATSKAGAEMAGLFRDLPEAIANTPKPSHRASASPCRTSAITSPTTLCPPAKPFRPCSGR